MDSARIFVRPYSVRAITNVVMLMYGHTGWLFSASLTAFTIDIKEDLKPDNVLPSSLRFLPNYLLLPPGLRFSFLPLRHLLSPIKSIGIQCPF